MSYLESEALCPYFDSDAFGIIKCEIGDLRILDNQMKRDVGYGLCALKYDVCPFKTALDRYYERKEVIEQERRIRETKKKNAIKVYKENNDIETALIESCDGEQLEWFID